MKLLVFLGACLLSSSALFADIITLNPGAKEIAGVRVSTGGKVDVEGRSYELTTLGAGKRWKITPFTSVYVVQVLSTSDASIKGLTADAARKALGSKNVVALHLDFVRNVGVQTLVEGFEKALEHNGVDTKEANMAAVLDAIGKSGDAAQDKSVTVLCERLADGSEVITWYNEATDMATSHTAPASANMIQSVLALVFGNLDYDRGLVSMQADLLKGL